MQATSTDLVRFLFASSLVLLLAARAQAHDPNPEATYLGNEGVLVTDGDTKVVFDAFYSDSYGIYTEVPATMRAALLAGEPPYDGIDAIFVSHVHGDHFSPAPTLAFMRAHPTVPLYASRQTYEAMLEATSKDDPVLARIVVGDLSPSDAPSRFDIDGLQIEAVAIPHAGERSRSSIQNLSWRVTLNETTTVLHLGDASIQDSDFAPHAKHFAARRASAAFPPHWFFDSEAGQTLIRTYLNADQVIGVHVPEVARKDPEAWRKRAGGDLFTEPGEKRSLNKPPEESTPNPEH